MPKTVITPDQDSLIGEIQIAAPPERVFQALSNAEQQRTWWDTPECPLELFEMDARRGGKWHYAGRQPQSTVKFDCHGEILEYDPPRVLAYTWITNWHEDKSRKTVVRWELSPKDGGTLVRVTHSGLAEEHVAREDYAGGWPGVLENLKKFAEK